MLTASDNVIQRIGMELLNPRLKFRDTQGSDPLEKAIEMASSKNQATYVRVLNILQNVQRIRSTYLRDQETVHGAHALENLSSLYSKKFGFYSERWLEVVLTHYHFQKTQTSIFIEFLTNQK